MRYSYGILKYNYPELERESTLLDNDYRDTKYALIEKQVLNDNSEVINRIIYSDNLNRLSQRLQDYISWYNYPVGKSKSIQGYISNLP